MNRLNNRFIVEAIRDELHARGVEVTSIEAALDITRLVAWRLRDDGACLVIANTDGPIDVFHVDRIAYADGQVYKILEEPGVANRPSWREFGLVRQARLREATMPDGQPGSGPSGPISTGAPPAADDDPFAFDVVRLFDSLERIADGLAGIADAVNRLNDSQAARERVGERVLR